MAQAGVDLRLEAREADVRRWPDVQVSVQRPASVVGHQYFHLSLGQVLDVLVERARLALFPLHRLASRLVFLIPKYLPTQHGAATARNLVLSRRTQEVARRFLVAGAERHGRVGS